MRLWFWIVGRYSNNVWGVGKQGPNGFPAPSYDMHGDGVRLSLGISMA